MWLELNKLEPLGFSVYYASYEAQKDLLLQNANKNALIFISLHITEEFDRTYCEKITQICHDLADMNYRIIADVSPNTIKQFDETNLVHLAKKLSVYALRFDFGFTDEEILDIAKQMPIVLNASTISTTLCEKAVALGNPVMAMHNFYPRRETGLDKEYFRETTQALQALGVLVLAFIPGNELLRGPLFEKLPTLESHRLLPPSVGYIDLFENFNVDAVFVGDPKINKMEQDRIFRYQNEGILEIPSHIAPGYEGLYNRIFTCRIDSPKWMVRAEESRIKPLFENSISSDGGISRRRGMITMDNERYERYAGEIQLLRQEFPADHRVNCVGEVQNDFLSLVDLIRRGQKFVFVKE